MYRQNRIIALIPARGGSKGLPGKNIKNFNGRPLIEWTVRAAQRSKYLDYLLVSTEDPEIRKICINFGLEMPYTRPVELADDKSLIKDVVRDAMKWLNNNQANYDYLILLQPTSPLRTEEHIDNAIGEYFLHKNHSDRTLISGYEAPKKNAWLLRKSDSDRVSFCFDRQKDKSLNRQDQNTFYLPNGAICIAPIKGFSGDFFEQPPLLFEMSEEESIDIDSQVDFDLALRLHIEREVSNQ